MKHFAKNDLRNRNALEVYFKASVVKKRMTDNPHFPDPSPSMAEFSAAINQLKLAMANNDGSTIQLAARDSAHKKVATMYRHLASHVTCVAQGNKEIILSSGYQLNQRKKKIYINEAPVIKRIQKINGRNSVKVRWSSVRKSLYYTVFLYEASDPQKVIMKVGVTRSSLIIQGLESGKKYMVRVRANGYRNSGPLSGAILFCEAWI